MSKTTFKFKSAKGSKSTKADYFLNIPPTPDFTTCKKARNGTFTGFEPNAEEMVFAKET